LHLLRTERTALVECLQEIAQVIGFTVHSTRLALPINHIQSREMMDWN